jgi:hypothetical protein
MACDNNKQILKFYLIIKQNMFMFYISEDSIQNNDGFFACFSFGN